MQYDILLIVNALKTEYFEFSFVLNDQIRNTINVNKLNIFNLNYSVYIYIFPVTSSGTYGQPNGSVGARPLDRQVKLQNSEKQP
jgi:hypothetical protein